MAVAAYIIDTVYVSLHSVLAHIGRVDGFFAAVGTFPFAGYIGGGMRC